MKRFLTGMCFLALAVVCLLGVPLGAEATAEGVYTYTVYNAEATITQYTGAGGDVVIPATLGGYPVTAVGDGAFKNQTTITSVVIPESVGRIGSYAFSSCFYLQSLSIPDSITAIDQYAFAGCVNLNYYIYDNGKYLGNAENPCVVFVGVTDENISSCMIHNKTKYILDAAFYNCRKLTTLTIPDSVVTIGRNAFQDCTHLSTLKLGKSVETIGDWAFTWCENLTNMTLPNGVKTIGSYVFNNCYRLKTVNIPASVTVIGEYAFNNCDNLVEIQVDAENLCYCNDEYGVLYNEEKTTLIRMPGAISGGYVIPDGVSMIGAVAFSSCDGLTALTIPASVTIVEDGAFAFCYGIKDVYYGDTELAWSMASVGNDNAYLTGAKWHWEHVHDYTAIKPRVKKATCTEDGYTEYICVHGETYFEYIPMLGHKYMGEVTKAPTCLEGGYSGPACSRCGDVRKDSVTEPLGHEPVIVPAKEATCLLEGTSSATQCGRCKVYLVEPTSCPALGHSFTRYTISKKATCTEDSQSTAKCDRCNATHTRVDSGSKLGHKAKVTPAVAPTCTKTGKTTGLKCSRCKVVLEARKTVSAIGHKYEKGSCKSCGSTPVGMKITSQPKSVKVSLGQNAETTVKAKGKGLTYTWYYKNAGESKYKKSSVSQATYSVKMSASRNGRYIYCIVKDAYGNSVKSDVVQLHMGKTVKITAQPKSVKVVSGQTAAVTVKATGDGLTYTWYYKNAGESAYKKSSVTQATYSVKMSASRKDRYVYCVVRDAYGNSVNTKAVKLRMANPAKITVQPKSVKVSGGEMAKALVKATGEGLTYTWYYKNAGATKYSKSSVTDATYTVKMTAKRNGRMVYCVVKDKYGTTVRSKAITLKMK